MNTPDSGGVRDGGLPAERTALAWTRTSFAVLGNGLVLVLKQFPHYHGPVPLIPAGIAAVVAFIVYLIGLQRQRTLVRRPRPDKITPRREVHLVAALVFVLMIVIAISLFV